MRSHTAKVCDVPTRPLTLVVSHQCVESTVDDTRLIQRIERENLRLQAPAGCPTPLFNIVSSCWNSVPLYWPVWLRFKDAFEGNHTTCMSNTNRQRSYNYIALSIVSELDSSLRLQAFTTLADQLEQTFGTLVASPPMITSVNGQTKYLSRLIDA